MIFRNSHPISSARFLRLVSALSWLATVCLALPLSGQEVVPGPPAEPLFTPEARKQAPPPPLSRPPRLDESPFKAGPVVFRPRLFYRLLSADGLPAVDGRRIASMIRNVSPSLQIDMGENWSLDYSPSWVDYTARAMADSTDHSASLSGGFVTDDWSLNFGQSYSESKSLLIETARQTAQKSWATTLGSSYRYSPKLQFGLSGSLNERYAAGAPDLKAWAGQIAIDYLLTSQLSLNFGPAFNYTEVADGPDYYGESVTAGISWKPAERLTLGISGGVEYTHSRSASAQDLSNPLLRLSLSYQPFEVTTLTAAVSRTVAATYFQGQAAENLSWSLNLSQRLLGKLYLNAAYNQRENDYAALQRNVVADRLDKIESYSFRLSTVLLRRLSVALVHQKSRNRSNVAEISFSSTQYGIELGYRY